ncbi:hypothetical protein BX600DRAFT_515834 [Xylariales sp. PMI_506]|nr:hypothetical protein BX600DRAFT_515834 [Xylariales sp. PMI_506]
MASDRKAPATSEASALSSEPVPVTTTLPAPKSPAGPTTSVAEAMDSTPANPKVVKPQPKKIPPGYKVIKVRDNDGKIKTVLRPLSPEELAAQASKAQQDSDTKPIPASNPHANLPSVKNVSPQHTNVANGAIKNVGSPPAEKLVATPQKASATPVIEKTESTNPIEATTPFEPSEAAFRQPEIDRRNRGKQRFKASLFRGLATVVGHAVPSIEIGHIEAGDQVISDDDSDDYDDSDDDDDRHSGHESHAGNHDDDDTENTAADSLSAHDHHHNNSESGSNGDHEVHMTANIGTGALVMGAGALANNTTAPKPPPPAVTKGGVTKAADNKNKVTYKITEKHLQEIDEKAAASLEDQPLERHWTDFSYYFMSSLSVVLPLLFLILGIGIALLEGKKTTSSWSAVDQATKVAISVWPIVFAAVVAQCLKTWAAFRVERGIKLMELEQLIGSNSFGSAIKQPLILRQIGLLSIFILFLWSFSPLGTQALQHTISSDFDYVTSNTTVYYVRMTGDNGVFQFDPTDSNSTAWDLLLQQVILYYQTPFTTASNSYYEYDLYGFPILLNDDYIALSNLGVPVLFNESIVNGDSSEQHTDTEVTLGNVTQETFTFNMDTSTINLTCPETWSTKTYKELNEISFFDYASSSNSYTFWIDLNNTIENSSSNFDTITLASLDNPGLWVNSSGYIVANDSMEFTYLECNLYQENILTSVWCYNDNTLPSSYCKFVPLEPNSVYKLLSRTPGLSITNTALNQWIGAGNPWNGASGETTATEFYLKAEYMEASIFNQSYVSKDWKLGTAGESTADAVLNLQALINTWVNQGYCPGCSSYQSWQDEVKNSTDAAYFDSTNAIWTYTGHKIYHVNYTFLALYFICAILMFVAGIISAFIDGMLVVPDVLGYASSAARNSRYLHLPKTSSKMSEPQRVRHVGSTVVMMQDVKANADVGRIALGNKHDASERLRSGRLYR